MKTMLFSRRRETFLVFKPFAFLVGKKMMEAFRGGWERSPLTEYHALQGNLVPYSSMFILFFIRLTLL